MQTLTQRISCLVKITGDFTMSFPAGITCILTTSPIAPVLSFRLVNIAQVDHFLPNQKLLYSDPSQSNPDSRDLWFNMQALNVYLQREAELNPQASYYNVTLLKYQVSSQDPGSAPFAALTNVQVLMALDHTATDLQCQPPAAW
ncbi:hypothetical protein AAFF_G00284650 [Aldrovandia affinis]|uniref:MHD domain-containing protein n=1 Tax=Aldrovandia affinis TaxID=143900 RepID=A0AAD7X200_9TELE|nr:hypothetical protein AAFF_G00284650 [Aldrovandia affinis]